MRVGCSVLFVVVCCCLSFVGRRLLFRVRCFWCALFVIRCVVLGVWCLVFVGCCSVCLVYVIICLLYVFCCMMCCVLFIVRVSLCVVRCARFAFWTLLFGD